MLCVIHIQAEPSQKNPSGCFTISTRLPRDLWSKLKPNAWYISQDDIDDEDAFDLVPGWHYSVTALKTLLSEGHALKMYGEDIIDISRLNYLLSEEQQQQRKDRQATESAESERLANELKMAVEVSRAAKEEAYIQWKENNLAGLTRIFAGPGEVVEWEKTAYFDTDTPGAWYTTGDLYESAIVEGQTVYRCSYGNAVAWYAPQSLVDQWCESDFAKRVAEYGLPKAARWVLEYNENFADCIWGDIAVRLVQIHGAEYFAQEARKEEWRILPFNGGYDMVRSVVEKYELPAVALRSIEFKQQPPHDALQLLIDPSCIGDTPKGRASCLYTTDDGRLFGCHSTWNVWELTAEQRGILAQYKWGIVL